MNIATSIYFRARRFVENYEKKQIAQQFDIRDARSLGIEYMKLFASLRAYDKNPEILLDIGAHKGLFTQAAFCFFPLEKAICVEPNHALHATIRNNNPQMPIFTEDIALGEKREKRIYFQHEDTAMNSLVSADEQVLRELFPYDNPDRMNQTTVQTAPLDDLLDKYELSKENILLKIDTQGNELEILKSGPKTLALTSLCVVEQMFIKAYHSTYGFEDLIRFFYDRGFTCMGPLTVSHRPNSAISSVDFLFIKT